MRLGSALGRALVVGLVVSGCATVPPDARATCRLLADDPRVVDDTTVRDLARLARGTPAESLAGSASAQRIATLTLGAVGSAALVAGLVEGFVGNPATQPAIRNGGYALGGGAIGLFGVALLLGFTGARSARLARQELRAWAAHCRSDEPTPVY